MEYAYIVKSVWDQTTKTSIQKTIRYLGKASQVTEEMVPIEYRGDPSIIAFITRYSSVNKKKNETMTRKLRREVFRMLSYNDLKGLLGIYDSYVNLYDMIQFYENLLKPVMYSVGQLWAEQKIDVVTEHVCVNTAITLIKIINERELKRAPTSRHNKDKILICTPNGEQHNLACNIIESVLLSKGYRVYNASPSLPTESVISAVNCILPDAILISVTIMEHLQTTKNLIRKIRTKSSLPIFVGGIALNDVNNTADFETIGAMVIRNVPLADLVKLLKSTLVPIYV
jgi:cobalamin-dependent methionine synthase I